jgi:ribosome-binding ATPase YchF (GTP1/OBG family)
MDNKTKNKTINPELIYYMFEEIKNELKDIKKDYVTKTESAALKSEIHSLRVDIEKLKDRNTLKNTVLWVGLTASAIINIVALYNIFTKG